MSNSWFQFKRFVVQQDKCAMKVGTDGVLLGAWAPLDGGLPVLDIGAGTGVVSLIAAQRLDASVPDGRLSGKCITAIELDPEASVQAGLNFAASPWSENLECICHDIRKYDNECSFGTILCNPPFFRDSLRCPDKCRNSARHGDDLSFEELAVCVRRMLAPGGLFSAVLPYDAVNLFVRAFAINTLYPVLRTDVSTVEGRTPKRTLIAFSHTPRPCAHTLLAVADDKGQTSVEYISLVKELYLKY